MSKRAPSQRALAQIAAHTRWALEPDRSAATSPARSAFLKKFEVEVDPNGQLPEAERALRAQNALRAHMARLRLASARSRKAGQPGVGEND